MAAVDIRDLSPGRERALARALAPEQDILRRLLFLWGNKGRGIMASIVSFHLLFVRSTTLTGQVEMILASPGMLSSVRWLFGREISSVKYLNLNLFSSTIFPFSNLINVTQFRNDSEPVVD